VIASPVWTFLAVAMLPTTASLLAVPFAARLGPRLGAIHIPKVTSTPSAATGGAREPGR
jgi:hypothetical protein